jgi:hypothetical protein
MLLNVHQHAVPTLLAPYVTTPEACGSAWFENTQSTDIFILFMKEIFSRD